MKRRRLSTDLIISILLIVTIVLGCAMAVYTVLLNRNLNRIVAGEIASGREAVRLKLQERTRRALLIARFIVNDGEISGRLLSGGDPSEQLKKYRSADIDADILTVLDADGVILAQIEPPDAITGGIPDRRGEPLFLNPLFPNAVGNEPAIGLEMCLPDVVCVDVFEPIRDRNTGINETSQKGQSGAPHRILGYVRVGFTLNDEFAREVRLTTGTDFFILRRNRGIASSLPPEKFSIEDAQRLADEIQKAFIEKNSRGRAGIKLTLSNIPYAVEAQTITDAAGEPIAVQAIGRSLADAESARREAVAFLAGIAAVGLLLAVALSVFSARRISRPLSNLISRVREITEGRLDAQVTAGRNDEIGELMGAFNEMTRSLSERDRRLRESADELRRNQDQLIQSGKLAAIGELAAGVAHEIGNPLSAISGYAQMIQEGKFTKEQVLEFAAEIERETEFIERIIQNLLEFSRPSKNIMEPADLREIAESAIRTASSLKAFNRIKVERRYPPELPAVQCDRKEIQQVFLNLIMNSAQAMPEGGSISIEGELLAGFVRFRVRDRGPGVPHEIREKIFNPFFTTKPPGVGTGLGLAITYRIIEKHGGSFVLEDTDEGASFSFTLPLARRN